MSQKFQKFKPHTGLCILLGAIAFAPAPASAAELFGVQLLGQKPADQTGNLRYNAEIIVENDTDGVKALLSATSLLVTDAKNGAADGFALLARAHSDEEQLRAALYTEARYAGKIEIFIEDRPLKDIDARTITGSDDQPVAVKIRVSPGPEFRFGNVSIGQTRPTQTSPLLSPDIYKLNRGEPARSVLIVEAVDRLVENWRGSGYPFAQVAAKEISADHERGEVDVQITIDPGTPAVYGWINVVGAKGLNNETIAKQSALSSGERFDPNDLKRSRERLRKLESIESVRIIEGEAVDGGGGIPITLEVRERKSRYIGGTASVSTLDGAEVNAYWGHRNVFGGGERLKVDAGVSRLGAEAFEDLEFDAGAVFNKPGIYDIDTEYFAEFRLSRDNPEPYDAFSARLKSGVSHRFNDTTTGSVAIEFAQTRIEDAFGERDHSLFSTPADINYDGRDKRLDPASGLHALGRFTPVIDVASGEGFLAIDGHIAGYQALDSEDRIVLAGRIGGGSVAGASLTDVPTSYRFFAGGGGSVRGYEYRSLGPLMDGQLAGGLSFASASAELRLRVSQQFGIVPFIDVASVSENELPDFSDATYVGAGLGLRYYTSLGPLRLDVAVPLTEREDRNDFALYVGLGQAF